MQRRIVTRDSSLSVRMFAGIAAVLLFYVAAEVVVCWLFVASYERGLYGFAGVIGFGAAAIGLPVLLCAHYVRAGSMMFHALADDGDLAPDDAVKPIVSRLAALAGIPTPETLVVRAQSANALAVPIYKTPSVVVVTTKLLDLLEPKEVEAVIAHELTHIANRDGEVLTFVGGQALGIQSLWQGDGVSGKVFAVLLSPLWLLGFLVMRGISRYREFAADRGSALITGAPEELMSALTKISGTVARGDLRGGATVEALCIIGTPRMAFFADHPPLAKRLSALANIAREMGTPQA